MKILYLNKSRYTPEVVFNHENGLLEITGSSYPENAFEFFQPLKDWVRGYIAEIGSDITLNLKLDYLNSSSTKFLLDLLVLLEGYSRDRHQVEINWYYEEDDEDLLEIGQEFAEDCEIPFNLISC